MAELKPAKLGSMAPGLNNRLPATKLSTVLPGGGQGTYLSRADNIDVVGGGNVKRRVGFTPAVAGQSCHSLWGDAMDGYCAIGNTLVHLAPAGAGLAAATVRAGLPELQPVSFARLPNGDVAWSNALEIGRLRADAALPLATPLQSTLPTLSAIAGSLPAGRYQVAVTNVSSLGESRSSIPVALDLPAGSGIRLAGLTGSSNVYMTGPNGSVFNEVPTAGDIVSLDNAGAPLRSLLLADLPPGHTLRWYKGSLLSALGHVLRWSEPFYPGLTNPSRNFVAFAHPITVVQPCEAGVFVGTTQRTYWLAGALNDTSPVVVLPYGGLQGSGGSVDTTDSPTATTQAFWLSPRGLVIGTPDGSAKNVQERALKFGGASAGATLFREHDGVHHILAVRQDAARPFAASRGPLNA